MAIVYLEGQVWRYKSRPQDIDSRLFIQKVDRQENGEEIFHVSLDGLRLSDDPDDERSVQTISHLPLSRQSLEASILEKLSFAGERPDYQEGYDQWHKAFAVGEAGVFDIPANEIVTAIAESMGT